MVKIFLVFMISTQVSYGQDKVFKFASQIPSLTTKLKELKLEEDARFEEQFSGLVRQLEQTLEKEKNICIGELSTEDGEIISKENRQVCLRSIKGYYLTSFNEIHQLKKRYMTVIHQRQMKALDENFEKLKAQFDKNF